jgi:hypothetical protein
MNNKIKKKQKTNKQTKKENVSLSFKRCGRSNRSRPVCRNISFSALTEGGILKCRV